MEMSRIMPGSKKIPEQFKSAVKSNPTAAVYMICWEMSLNIAAILTKTICRSISKEEFLTPFAKNSAMVRLFAAAVSVQAASGVCLLPELRAGKVR